MCFMVWYEIKKAICFALTTEANLKKVCYQSTNGGKGNLGVYKYFLYCHSCFFHLRFLLIFKTSMEFLLW